MDIERSWGKEPGWFGAQDAETQARLLAYRNVRVSPKRTA